MYASVADAVADRSYARRLKVGCIIVKDDCIISDGRNGTPAGWDNNCETVEWCTGGGWLDPDEIETGWPLIGTYTYEDGSQVERRYRLTTKPEVLHAERNAINKLAKHGHIGGVDATMFVTHAPCLECAKSIYSAGIKDVFYKIQYRDNAGIDFLLKAGIAVTQLV